MVEWVSWSPLAAFGVSGAQFGALGPSRELPEAHSTKGNHPKPLIPHGGMGVLESPVAAFGDPGGSFWRPGALQGAS